MPNDQSSDKVPEIEEYVRSVAPADVVRTLGWLLMNRWVVSNAKYGGDESFGNAQIEFDRDGDRVTVTRGSKPVVHAPSACGVEAAFRPRHCCGHDDR